jgi:hypothetical protein
MKKLFLIVLSIFFIGCDDGDLEVDSLDFDPDSVQSCEGSTTLLFNINADEAMILTLDASLIVNEATAADTPRTGTIEAGDFDVILRVFSETVSNTYFCAAVPQTSPSVITELFSKRGTIAISTTASDTNNDAVNDTFEHEILFQNVVFDNDRNGERLIEESYIFGYFTTTN